MRKIATTTIAGAACLALGLTLTGCGSSSGSSAAAADCTPAHAGLEPINAGKLTVGTPVTPPYVLKNGTEISGVDAEIIKEIAAMECLEVDWQEMTFAAGMQSLQSGRVDTTMGGVYRTAERAELLDLGATAYRDGVALLSKEGYKSLEDLSGKKVGVIQGYLWNKDLQAALGNDSVKQYQTSDALFSDLKAGRIDVAVFTTAEAAYRLSQAPSDGFVSEAFEPTEKVQATLEAGQVVLPHPKGADAMTEAFEEDIKTLVENGRIGAILSEQKMDPALAGDAK
ncbi:cystine ABC transporter substrate-binding protein [Zafaria cholistanensis]|uniref:Cystine ABC transporter substrate-binding protein n=1 Tax=Zafaria cholistanensis TaxID=1682741 RepID=A0A5A7NKM5_9MICC|nr:transporter substrate-binding domain-containing protein [Zafaria cholistanensis]GER21523.1 cystine ABC transporter substrate-binding protein [Zafaria cholistanensis]